MNTKLVSELQAEDKWRYVKNATTVAALENILKGPVPDHLWRWYKSSVNDLAAWKGQLPAHILALHVEVETRFPHTCRCGSPAYFGATPAACECSRAGCRGYAP